MAAEAQSLEKSRRFKFFSQQALVYVDDSCAEVPPNRYVHNNVDIRIMPKKVLWTSYGASRDCSDQDPTEWWIARRLDPWREMAGEFGRELLLPSR